MIAPLKEFEINRNLLALQRELGEGQFGTVFEGLLRAGPNSRSVSSRRDSASSSRALVAAQGEASELKVGLYMFSML